MVEKKKKDLYEGVPVTSLMTRQHIYDHRHDGTPWWKPAFDKEEWVVLAMIIALILCLVGIAMIPGCAAPQEPHTSLVFHVTGTIYDPEISRDFSRGEVLYDPTAPEFSRNDEYMGIRSQHERYLRHLSLTIKSTDRQSTINGRIVDRHTTETKTTERK